MLPRTLLAGALLVFGAWAGAQTPPAATTAPVMAPGAAAVEALSFAQAFDAALLNDPQLRSARFERESTQANVPIARAGLLPTANLSVSDASVRGTRQFPNALAQQVTLDVDYTTPQAALQIRAPLFNWDAIQRYRQALVQSDAADAIFRVRGNELIDRLALAYLQRLLAAENVRLIESQIAALDGQLERAAQRLQRGEGTRIEIADVQAQLEVARVRLLDARDQVGVARLSLLRITGVDAPAVRSLPEDFRPPLLVPRELDEWITLALSRNPAVQAREQQVQVSRLGVHRARAGHYPRLDAVASLARSSNESLSTINQSSRLATFGVQLNVPLFSGGGVEAAVQQALSEVGRSEADLANERENARLEVQRHYLAVSHGSARIEALTQALAALEMSLEGIRRGVPAGLRTLAEVLEAQSRVFSARRDLAQARMDYLLARLRLQAQAGAPLADIVLDIERLLGARS